MPADNHELTELREQLSARGQAQSLLHLSYRQPVFGRGDNYPVRLFAAIIFLKVTIILVSKQPIRTRIWHLLQTSIVVSLIN